MERGVQKFFETFRLFKSMVPMGSLRAMDKKLGAEPLLPTPVTDPKTTQCKYVIEKKPCDKGEGSFPPLPAE